MKWCLNPIPQLATQWMAIHTKAHFNIYPLPLQYVSIASSTIAIIISIVNWVARNRREQWIHTEYPSAASLLPIWCLLLTNVFSGTASFQSVFSFDVHPFLFLFVIAAYPVSTLFTLFIIVTRCRSACCMSRCWKISRTATHFCVSSVVPGCCLYLLATYDARSYYESLDITDKFNHSLLVFIIF